MRGRRYEGFEEDVDLDLNWADVEDSLDLVLVTARGRR